MHIDPFRIAIPDADLADLQARLARTRLAPALEAQGWSEGIDPGHLARLLAHWQHGFDWRAVEARLNRLPQYRARIDQHTIHFVHQPGTGPAPLPLVITHGWPGSFIEMEAIIALLADPGAHGADPADAFHVVAPSLPGYGFSPAPARNGTGPFEVAGLWKALMEGLGYPRFGAQGGDIGAGVSAWLGQRFPEQLIGMHLNFLPGSYRPPQLEERPPTPKEQDYLNRIKQFQDQEGAYAHQQSTKPYTLAVGLHDSPAGLAAWIGEKFHAWTDQDVDLDTLLANISLYWFTGTIGSSFRMYVEGRARPMAPQAAIEPPLGVALFPHEIAMPPRSWAERCFDVRRWTEMPAGGHFAALEQPQLLAEEIRAFFRPLRGG
jgi:pimeloyl-ACP methyl ester carboxylesterase